MTETQGRDRSPVIAVAGMLGLVAAITVGALALGSSTPAAASGLEQFSSCEELQAWTTDVQPAGGGGSDDLAVPDVAAVEESGRASGAGGDVPVAAPAAGGAPATSLATEASAEGAGASDLDDAGAATGGTNTVVEGVDEIDVIDRVADDRLLVSRNGVLALVDLAGRAVVAELAGVPYDARISVADGIVFVAGSSNDGLGTEVRRVRIDGDNLVDDGRWTTPGFLLDARRTGDQLHVVAVDHPQVDAIPFDGGPVPCDQVWRPVDPATTPSATLVATLPASGELAPVAAAEVTGSAGNLLVTDGAVYVATETWSDDGDITTGVHRFDVGSLTPTGSGTVPGTVAGPFALSEHEGHLRVATSAGGGFVGRPLPVEGDVIVDDAVGAPAGAEPGVAVAVAEEPPTTVVPAETTSTTDLDSTTTTTEVEETTTTSQPAEETTTTAPEEPTTTTAVADESALAEVFVLDTEGDLDLVGRTGRFGHDFETIHGVRFVGDVAYVVTFRQTDPFWVIDLADPAAPVVAGQLQIPGFSGYLHPAGEGRVVGFGPDGNGSIAARLFDVSDPAAPSLVDEIRLGDDSPVAYDHHAFVGLEGGRFAVPVTEYPEYVEGDCRDIIPPPEPVPAPLPVDPGIGDGTGGGSTGSTGIAVGEPVPCEVRAIGGESGAAVLEVADGRLTLVDRATIESAEVFAERVIEGPDGTWFLLSWDRLVATDTAAPIILPTA